MFPLNKVVLMFQLVASSHSDQLFKVKLSRKLSFVSGLSGAGAGAGAGARAGAGAGAHLRVEESAASERQGESRVRAPD